MMADRLLGCTALFWALPRGRGPVPRSWKRWARAQPCQHAGCPDEKVKLVPFLHCPNIYQDGFSATVARPDLGGFR